MPGFKFPVLTLSCTILCSLGATAIFAQDATLAAAVKNGSHAVSMRYRYEDVEQNNALKDAAANTVLTRLALTTGKYKNFSGLIEFDNVSTVGSDRYDSFVLDQYRGKYSVIADPVGTEVNQISLSYAPDTQNTFTAGRQRLNHANQRFVGGVGWRQNEQTYDAASYRLRSGAVELDYSYIWNVNRVFNSSSVSSQITDFDSDSHALLGKYTQPWGSVSGFMYALDFDNAKALSSITWGASYAGKLGPVTVSATVAQQSDYGPNPTSYDAGYFAADAAIDVAKVKLLAGYEVLGSDDSKAAFNTPLATLHLFQGWTDLFLTTPLAGVEDISLTASGTLHGIGLAVSWHDLASEEGSIDYGTEWNLVANYRLNPHLTTQLKYASYDSDAFAVDTDKLWLTLSLAF